MSDHLPAPRADSTPTGTGYEGLSFLRLAGHLVALAARAIALREGLSALRRRMERDAADADQLAEACAEAGVDARYTEQMHEAAGALRDVARAAVDLDHAAEDLDVDARGARDAHESEYRGIYEAVQSSGVRQAKPGFYRTD